MFLPAPLRSPLLGLLLAACGGAVEEGQVDDFPAPSSEIADPFSIVSGVLPLRDGRLVVADIVEAALAVVDFAQGTRVAVGRQGSGPGEYRAPAALLLGPGDSIWVLDAAQQRVVVFTPDLRQGTPFPFMLFDQATTTQFTPPYFGDGHGRIYSSAMALQMGGGGVRVPDSVGVVRLDPRGGGGPTELARVRFPTSGQPEMTPPANNVIKYKSEFPGLVAADAWVAFPDGRIAIVRGATYALEFMAPGGAGTTHGPVEYDRYPVTEADQDAEMEEVRRQMAEQTRAVQRTLPANFRIEFEITPPAQWPAAYPPIAPLGALAAPDGRLWVKRSVPIRVGRERWDVIDETGTLVAQWRLPLKTTLVALGDGVAYTVRTDEDDLRYVQRVPLPE